MEKFYMLKDGVPVCLYSRAGVSDTARANGQHVEIGDNWQEYPLELTGCTLLPMDDQPDHEHNTPVIVDGRVVWMLPDAE